jgi:hypothetical protein
VVPSVASITAEAAEPFGCPVIAGTVGTSTADTTSSRCSACSGTAPVTADSRAAAVAGGKGADLSDAAGGAEAVGDPSVTAVAAAAGCAGAAAAAGDGPPPIFFFFFEKALLILTETSAGTDRVHQAAANTHGGTPTSHFNGPPPHCGAAAPCRSECRANSSDSSHSAFPARSP